MGYTLLRPKTNKPEKNMLVTQANKLVEARYTLSLYEQRLVLMMISMIEPKDEDFKDYIIRISDFSDLIGLKSRNLYPTIKNLLIKLRERTLVIEKGKDYLITGWISSAEYVSSEGVVKLSFDAKLKPFLLQLKQEFTKQRLGTVIKFKGIYTIRIYGLLKQYEKLGVRTFTVEEFRKILGIEEKKYKAFRDLKLRTILQAQKEFSKQNECGAYLSDINFDFEPMKTGRKITGLKFIIRKQNTAPLTIEPKRIKEQATSPLIAQYEAFGIKQSVTLPYLKKDGEEALKRTLSIFEKDKKSGKIRSNEQGYLVTLLKSGAGVITEGEKQDLENKKNKEREELKRRQQEQREKELLLLEKKYLKNRKDTYLSSLDDEAKTDLLETLREKYSDNSFFLKMITDINSACIQDDLNVIVKNEEGYKTGKDKYLSDNLKGLTKEA